MVCSELTRSQRPGRLRIAFLALVVFAGVIVGAPTATAHTDRHGDPNDSPQRFDIAVVKTTHNGDKMKIEVTLHDTLHLGDVDLRWAATVNKVGKPVAAAEPKRGWTRIRLQWVTDRGPRSKAQAKALEAIAEWRLAERNVRKPEDRSRLDPSKRSASVRYHWPHRIRVEADTGAQLRLNLAVPTSPPRRAGSSS